MFTMVFIYGPDCIIDNHGWIIEQDKYMIHNINHNLIIEYHQNQNKSINSMQPLSKTLYKKG